MPDWPTSRCLEIVQFRRCSITIFPTPGWLISRVLPGFAYSTCCVLISDDGLLEIKKLPSLERLKLRNSQVSDAGLKQIADIKRLKGLILEDAAISDAGLAYLKPLARLDELNLMRNNVTDAGLANLAGLDVLKPIELRVPGSTARAWLTSASFRI